MVEKREDDAVSAPAPDGKSGKKGKRKKDNTSKAVKKQKTKPGEVALVNDEPNKVKEELTPKKEPEKKKKRKSREKSNDSKVEPGSICDKANGEPEKKKKKRKRQQKSNDSKVEPGSICDKANGPKTPPSTSVTTPLPNSLFVANLAGCVDDEILRKFFKDAGDIVDIQFDTFDDGTSRGFARVEFATAEAVEKRCVLSGQTLMGQPVKLNYGCEQRLHSPGSRDISSFRKPRHFSKNTVLIRGFDPAYGLEEMKIYLDIHFAGCDAKRVLIETDDLTGASKGIAFMELGHSDAVSLALEKNGSVLRGFTLKVEELEHDDAEELEHEDAEPSSPDTPEFHCREPSTGVRTVFHDDD